MEISSQDASQRLAAYDIPILDDPLSSDVFQYHLNLEIKVDRFIQKPLITLTNLHDEVSSHDHIDPLIDLRGYQVTNLAGNVQLPANEWQRLYGVLQRICRCFRESDASRLQVELVSRGDGGYLASCVRMDVDRNALFRQRWLPQHNDIDRRVVFVPMDGQIGCIVNGAGLGILTHDLIYESGNEHIRPANFVDFVGSISPELIRLALDKIFALPSLKVLLVTVFGGLTRCDQIAETLVAYYTTNQPATDAIIRFDGTNSLTAREQIRHSGIEQFQLAYSQRNAVLAAINTVEGAM